jgi:HD-GYP domain-containing protein (c-di-GMP phosphodiesterase class II)
LTSEENQLVQLHPVIGERILTPIIQDRVILAGIRGHHERIDGGGYPDGLRGDRVPLLARLIAVPDCFDAMTSHRAYRAALPVEEALKVLRAGSGTHFDPSFVRAFLEVLPRIQSGAEFTGSI